MAYRRNGKYNVAPKERRMAYGILFDSMKERDRYLVLRDMEKKGEIRDLEYHKPQYKLSVDGELITKYEPDFTYYTQAGDYVVEDVKPAGMSYRRTQAYRYFVLKKKLMKAIYNIEIQEV